MRYLPAFCLLLLISCKHTQLSSRITTPVSVAQLRADSARFHSRSLDVDADGLPDELFWHKHGEGDSLFVFRAGDAAFLQTAGFSEDWLFVIDNVQPRLHHKPGFVLHRYFNGAGGMEQTIELRYHKRRQRWEVADAANVQSE